MGSEQFIFAKHSHCCRALISHFIVAPFQLANKSIAIDLREFYRKIWTQKHKKSLSLRIGILQKMYVIQNVCRFVTKTNVR